MISLYVISKEIDHTQIENVSKQPFWSFLLKEYFNVIQRIRNHKMWINLFKAYPLNFQFNLITLVLICLGISYTDKFYISLDSNDSMDSFRFTSENIPDKIRIALNILLLPCMAFYLIQIPFKLKHFWLYFFLVFLVFFLAHYFLPRITSGLYPNEDYPDTYGFRFGCFEYDKKNKRMYIFPILAGILLFFKFPYNHWVSFAFGILIFCVIIFWIWNFYNEYIVPFTSMYNFGTLDFYKFSFETKDHKWVMQFTKEYRSFLTKIHTIYNIQ